MLLILAFFTYLKSSATKSLLEFPPNMNCDYAKKIFSTKLNNKEFAEFDKDHTLN